MNRIITISLLALLLPIAIAHAESISGKSNIVDALSACTDINVQFHDMGKQGSIKVLNKNTDRYDESISTGNLSGVDDVEQLNVALSLTDARGEAIAIAQRSTDQYLVKQHGDCQLVVNYNE